MQMLKIVCMPVFPWQYKLLELHVMRAFYLAIDRPVKLRKLLIITMLSMDFSYPARFVRILFEIIRFNFGYSSNN
jgi:hypothetical protein